MHCYAAVWHLYLEICIHNAIADTKPMTPDQISKGQEPRYQQHLHGITMEAGKEAHDAVPEAAWAKDFLPSSSCC